MRAACKEEPYEVCMRACTRSAHCKSDANGMCCSRTALTPCAPACQFLRERDRCCIVSRSRDSTADV